jgi:hypothetical protein
MWCRMSEARVGFEGARRGEYTTGNLSSRVVPHRSNVERTCNNHQHDRNARRGTLSAKAPRADASGASGAVLARASAGACVSAGEFGPRRVIRLARRRSRFARRATHRARQCTRFAQLSHHRQVEQPHAGLTARQRWNRLGATPTNCCAIPCSTVTRAQLRRTPRKTSVGLRIELVRRRLGPIYAPRIGARPKRRPPTERSSVTVD